ncbi:hypothetical protein TNCV_2038971 [Trichonephila clavipes]|nr:hypothetical protein TNCV_2038971 [Trichonephila clavipes]
MDSLDHSRFFGTFCEFLRRAVREKIDTRARWDEKMDGDCKAKLAAGTVGFEAGVSLFTDPISDREFIRGAAKNRWRLRFE